MSGKGKKAAAPSKAAATPAVATPSAAPPAAAVASSATPVPAKTTPTPTPAAAAPVVRKKAPSKAPAKAASPAVPATETKQPSVAAKKSSGATIEEIDDDAAANGDGEGDGEGDDKEFFDEKDASEMIAIDGEAPPDDDDDGKDDEDDDEKIPDEAEVTFTGHTDEVYCVAVNGKLACTGGGDDKAYVWNIDDGELKFAIEGHTDTVFDVGFSPDGKYVATASLDKTCRVYEVATGTLWKALDGPAEDLEWLEWLPKGHALAVGSRDTTVHFWDISTGKCLRVFAGHHGPVLCGAWAMPRLITGGEDGSTFIWSGKTGLPEFHLEGKNYHQGPVTCLAVHHSEPLLLTGGAEGWVFLVNTNTGKVLKKLGPAQLDEKTRSIEAVGFCKTHALIAAASMDGNINVWDQKTYHLRTTLRHGTDGGVTSGVTHMQWHPSEPLIFSASLDSSVRVWDARDGTLIRTWTGHKALIQYFVVSADGRSVITAADDSTSKVFKL